MVTKPSLGRLFEPKPYYQRVLAFLSHFRPNPCLPVRLPNSREALAVVKIMFELGVREPGQRAFWSYLGRLLRHHSQLFTLGMSLAATGYHFRIITKQSCERITSWEDRHA